MCWFVDIFFSMSGFVGIFVYSLQDQILFRNWLQMFGRQMRVLSRLCERKVCGMNVILPMEVCCFRV